jgi:hypothetical protein
VRISLLEFFALNEVDPLDKPAPNKHPGQQMPSGLFKTRPQGQPPEKKTSTDPTSPDFKRHKVQPKQTTQQAATALLAKAGQLTGLKGPGSGVAPQQPGRGAAGAGQKEPQSGAIAKPKYNGKFIGQTVDMGGEYVSKPVSWQNKQDPEIRRYGRVQSKQTQKAVWDGTDWVSQAEFQRKFPGKR